MRYSAFGVWVAFNSLGTRGIHLGRENLQLISDALKWRQVITSPHMPSLVVENRFKTFVKNHLYVPIKQIIKMKFHNDSFKNRILRITWK